MKSCSVHLAGMVLAVLTPEPSGPRNRVHSWPGPWAVEIRSKTRTGLWRAKKFIALAGESIEPGMERNPKRSLGVQEGSKGWPRLPKVV